MNDVFIPPAGLDAPQFRLCPRCARAVPARSSERYCINDGTWLLERCPLCGAAITSPYTRFCAACGLGFANATERASEGV